MPKLIVLRGNSGSGKSTVALRLQGVEGRKIALVEQDYVRRKILKEKEADDGIRIAMLSAITELALTNEYDVVLEGILGFKQYGAMLRGLADRWPEHHFFYFDIPLQETLRRHATKPNADDFGQAEMTSWYRENDATGFAGETIISAQSTLDQTVQRIVEITGL